MPLPTLHTASSYLSATDRIRAGLTRFHIAHESLARLDQIAQAEAVAASSKPLLLEGVERQLQGIERALRERSGAPPPEPAATAAVTAVPRKK